MNEKIGKEAFELYDQIRENELHRRELMANNTELLYKIKERELYKAILGDENGEWAGFLGLVDVYYSRSDVNKLISIFKKFTLELEIKIEQIIDIPRTRLVDILKLVTKENVDDWLSKAKELTSRDWRIETREAKGLPTEDDCLHKYQKYEICKICGERHKLEHSEISEESAKSQK